VPRREEPHVDGVSELADTRRRSALLNQVRDLHYAFRVVAVTGVLVTALVLLAGSQER
jgi:hypothetical protein